MPNSDVRVSIVSACRNERREILAFLDSLLAQDMTGISWEALIADGMSDDGTRELLSAYAERDARLRVIDNPGRIVSTGLNAAIRAARGTIIIRMDAHTFYAPDYCRRCIQVLETTGAENVGGPARTKAEGVMGRAIAAAYHSPFSTGGAVFHDENYEGYADTVPYGCWRRSTFDRIGYFDEVLVRNQDDELNLRILRSGGRIWQSSQIVSWYRPRSRLSGLFRQYFQYGFWKVAVIRKHRIPGSWRHLIPAAFVAGNALLLALMIVIPAAAAVWMGAAALYLILCMMAAILAARRHGWSVLLALPLVFATYHVSYGLGFLAGVVCFAAPVAGGARSAPLFSRLSR
jgi:succinoglycan biosynthesis protein ExoA